MTAYDAGLFDPPAPVALVTLRHPATGVSASDVPMLIDTGADVTMIPRIFAEQIGLVSIPDKRYELQGFDGNLSLAEAVVLELVFLNRKFKGQFLLIDQPIGVMGRNVLNSVALLFDGPHGMWIEQGK